MMRTSLHRGTALALGLLLALTACGGENAFPGLGITNGATDTGTILGSVTSSGVGVGGVEILLLGARRDSTLTNSQGQYRFERLAAGTYDLSIRVPLNYTLAPGDSATQRVQLAARGQATVNWRLQPQGPTP